MSTEYLISGKRPGCPPTTDYRQRQADILEHIDHPQTQATAHFVMPVAGMHQSSPVQSHSFHFHHVLALASSCQALHSLLLGEPTTPPGQTSTQHPTQKGRQVGRGRYGSLPGHRPTNTVYILPIQEYHPPSTRYPTPISPAARHPRQASTPSPNRAPCRHHAAQSPELPTAGRRYRENIRHINILPNKHWAPSKPPSKQKATPPPPFLSRNARSIHPLIPADIDKVNSVVQLPSVRYGPGEERKKTKPKKKKKETGAALIRLE